MDLDVKVKATLLGALFLIVNDISQISILLLVLGPSNVTVNYRLGGETNDLHVVAVWLVFVLII